MSESTNRSDPHTGYPAGGRLLRAAASLALVLVLALAFMGYLSADMKLQWENLMALCGF